MVCSLSKKSQILIYSFDFIQQEKATKKDTDKDVEDEKKLALNPLPPSNNDPYDDQDY